MSGACRAHLSRACAVLCAAILLAGCGGGSSPTGRLGQRIPKPPGVIDVYASLPLRGPLAASAMPVLRGVELAYRQAHEHAGRFHVRLKVLDSTRSGAVADAATAATDPLAMLFIGGFTNNGSELTAPVLAQAGIPDISPGATYVGLTRRIPGVTAPGEPDIYSPGSPQARTYLRLIPSDAVEAAADLLVLQQERCGRVAIAHDSSAYGSGLAQMLVLGRGAYGIQVVADAAAGSSVRAFRTLAATVRARGAQCFVFAGADPTVAVPLITEIHQAALPSAPVLVTDRLCNRALTDPARGGLPPELDPFVLCTLPTLPAESYRGGRGFTAAFRAAFGGARPGRYAIFGYEAMRLGLDTIASLGSDGDSRPMLVHALRGMANRYSVLGVYRFDDAGDSTLDIYGLYRISPVTRAPHFWRALAPQRVP